MKWLGIVAVMACSFEHGITPSDSHAPPADAKVDAPPLDSHVADAAIDAPNGLCNETVCSAAGGQCTNSSTCEIGTTGGNVTCPAGMDCLIHCESSTACNGTIDCAMARSCTIDCLENGTCAGIFDCSHVPCTIYCRGNNTCQDNDIDDTNSTCDIECCGNSACIGAFASPTVCSNHGDICP